ncbi:MAG: phosphoribosylglycinamide formyltransferase [Coriobacteriales bacterium]|jgi:phosphoribosylglycinamide formyltransferase-1|nr:phosphoribosylglycinamide formyltransferase [Coriobacteriales bacterium]
MIRLGVLISGAGSNLQAILDAIAAGKLDAEVVLVISSRPDAGGLKRATAAGIATVSLSRSVYNEPWAADELISDKLIEAGCDYVVLAGYMRKVHPELLDSFPDRVLNIHPALLPAFIGSEAIRQAWEYGVKVAGVTVHYVNQDYDRGAIIAQRALDILPGESLEALTMRVHHVEHQIYPEVLQLFAENRISKDTDGRVVIR